MATSLSIRLPWGRYHATPWGRNVNEATVEWPPSPWRILRALYSTWKTRCADLGDDQVLPLLGRLAEPPRYRVPPFTVAHTRHYLPGVRYAPAVVVDTVKTFDPFVVTARDAEVVVQWAFDADDAERVVLARLAEELPYLGRAESIVSAGVGGDAGDAAGWIEPGAGGHDGTQLLLAPVLPLDVGALVLTPNDVRGERRTVPPATKWVSYPRPTPCRPVAAPVPHRARPVVTAVRLAITGNARPARGAAVACADLVRRAAMSHFGGGRPGVVSTTLSGKDTGGAQRHGPHAHAHYLPILDRSGKRLDAIVVWAPEGFGDGELLAFEQCRRLQPPSGQNVPGLSGRQLYLGVESMGSAGEVAPSLVTPARVWASVTPYSPTRHRPGSLESQLADDVAAELSYRGLPPPDAVELVRGDWLSFRRYRLNETIHDQRRAYGLRITFAEPAEGPLALGQLSHFGLGLFRPSRSAS